jgi:hypothetical protein
MRTTELNARMEQLQWQCGYLLCQLQCVLGVLFAGLRSGTYDEWGRLLLGLHERFGYKVEQTLCAAAVAMPVFACQLLGH